MMLPVLGDRGFFGERKKDDSQASAAISSGVVAELQGQTDKGDLFCSKAELFPKHTFLQLYCTQRLCPHVVSCKATR